MNSLKELLKALDEDENIVRFKELEHIIDHDVNLSNAHELLKDLQKKLVFKEANKEPHDKEKTAYDNQLKEITKHFLMSEYLELLELVNNDLQLINMIISDEINMDFDK